MSKLDPAVEAMLANLSSLPPFESLPAEVARQLAAKLSDAVPPGLPLHSVEDRMAGTVPVRIYSPSEEPHGAMVWLHGGGWTFGGLDSSEAALRSFALRTGLRIISVDYRLAPEHPFPAPFSDAVVALRWVVQERIAHGMPLLLGGESAGGNLAAVLAIFARDAGGPPVSGQILFYPVTDADFNRLSYRENANGYFLTRSLMQWFWDNYVPDYSLRKDWRVSPLQAATLAGLPPALIQTAEFDPLRDEGEAYAMRLQAAGNAVTCKRYRGLIHGHFAMGAIPAAAAAIEDAALWVDGLLHR